MLAFRNELSVLAVPALVCGNLLLLSRGGVARAIGSLVLLVLVAAPIWSPLHSGGLRPRFDVRLSELFVYACLTALGLALAEALFSVEISEVGSGGALSLSVVAPVPTVALVLNRLRAVARRGPHIVFFRSFSGAVSSFTAWESAPTLAGFGRLQIVNDEVTDEVMRAPMFGISALALVPVPEQVFARKSTWKSRVVELINDADLFVVDVTCFTPGLAWEVERIARDPNAAVLFVARNGFAADGFEPFKSAFQGATTEGTLPYPIPYRTDPVRRLFFRLRVIRWMLAEFRRTDRRYPEGRGRFRPSPQLLVVREAGFPLLFGVVVFPQFFCWLTLREGYTSRIRHLAFAWAMGSTSLLLIGRLALGL